MSAQLKEVGSRVGTENTSGLSPLGHAVLVEPYEPEIRAGAIYIPENVAQGMQQVDQRVTVIAVGPTAWQDEPSPRAGPGDKVLVTKYAGWVAGKGVTADGKTYRMVNDRDIFCRIDGGAL